MPLDPDQDDRVDIELTDELPVLIETAVFESDLHLIAVPEDEGEDREHTARVLALAPQEAEGVEALKNDLEQRATKIEALERDVTRLSERWLEMERRLNEKDAAISSLTSALEAARTALKERRGVEDGLAAEIADRDNRIARLLDETDRLRREAAEAHAELERFRQEHEVEGREAATLRAERESAQLAAEARKSAALDSELKKAQTDAAAIQSSLDHMTAEREAAREEIVATHAQLEQARADSARLERALGEKDRALAARDERIRTLQLELEQRLGALERPNAQEPSRQTYDSSTSAQRADVAPESASTPALICLTGDGPRAFALAQGTLTIGRSSECDIQILTHFVSREHARLTVSPRGGVLIEDLNSTNGVFVNSVRIDRQELRHGDLVTVGESQFRFLESMAH